MTQPTPQTPHPAGGPLHAVKQPAQYVGNELNACIKDPASVAVRFAFCFPDTYDIGMSSLGLKLLYDLLNSRQDCYCERAFAPWADREAQLRAAGQRLSTLETDTPLCAFDIVGFTLQYELCYTNILLMMDLGGIPLCSADRGQDCPIIVAGGSCATNPEPLADFIDVFMIGDGEEVIGELVDCIRNGRQAGASRREILLAAAAIPGCYVPQFYALQGGQVAPVVPGVPQTVTRRVVRDLEHAHYPSTFIVPYVQTVHDRMVLEICRGCTRGCRFCQAGMLYRPVRERSLPTLMQQAQALYDSTGFDEIGFCALSAGDYTHIRPLVSQLTRTFAPQKVSLSLPSMRLDAMPGDYLQQLATVRRTGLTFAPEAGTQRLRNVINKNITDDDLVESLTQAYANGWSQAKLYFMIGLPTETQEDLDGIVDLARRAVMLYKQVPHTSAKQAPAIGVSASTFVPKPHTPFQWCAQDSMEEILQKQAYLRKAMRRAHGATLATHTATVSVLEAVFARGDRRLCQVLLQAYQTGCRFDGWTECFRFERWQQAFAACGLSMEQYSRAQYAPGDALPWSVIDIGVTQEFLAREYNAALAGQTTPDCRNGCLNCGVNHLCGGKCPIFD